MKSKFTLMVVILLATLSVVAEPEPAGSSRSSSPTGLRNAHEALIPAAEIRDESPWQASLKHVRARSDASASNASGSGEVREKKGNGILRPSSPASPRKHRSLEIAPKHDNSL